MAFVVIFLFTRLSFFMLVFVLYYVVRLFVNKLIDFVFVTFVYNFNVKRCTRIISVSRFFYIRNNMYRAYDNKLYILQDVNIA